MVRVSDRPPGYAALVEEAEREGLPAPKVEGAAPGEIVVFAALADGDLAAVGALAPDADPPRIFNLFVRRRYRRLGVGRMLAGALAHEALDGADAVCADAADANAARFWEAIGFRPSPGPRRTHLMRRNGA